MDTTATAVLVPGGKEEVRCPLPAPVGMTMCSRFDAYLAEQAACAGAEVRDGCTLTTMDPDGTGLRLLVGRDHVEARYVIGADGANGVTGKLAGFPPIADPGVAIEVELAVSEGARTISGCSAAGLPGDSGRLRLDLRQGRAPLGGTGRVP
jgi:flavin-dependent dehydrogenase